MAEQSKQVTIKVPGNVVALCRWAGIFVLVSAVVLAIWTAFDPTVLYANSDTGDISGLSQIRVFWQTLVELGWPGIAIVLLGELVERLRRPA